MEHTAQAWSARFGVENLKAAGIEPVYAMMWLPHDAEAKSLGTGRRIETDIGTKNVLIDSNRALPDGRISRNI